MFKGTFLRWSFGWPDGFALIAKITTSPDRLASAASGNKETTTLASFLYKGTFLLPLKSQVLQVLSKDSFVWIGTSPMVHLMNPEDVKLILTKMDSFAKPEPSPLIKLLAQGIAVYEGEKWVKHRRIINPAFHVEKLKRMLPAIHESCNDMIKEWFVPTKMNRRMKQIDKEIRGLLKGIIAKREQAIKAGEATKDDLIGALLESSLNDIQENGKNNKNVGMSIEDVIEECRLFYFAGQETTSVLLVWTMILVAQNQDWQDRARQEVLQVGSGSSKVRSP
ncbi:hypothetical protein ACLB2K_028781 [Fragaria x ananassa]